MKNLFRTGAVFLGVLVTSAISLSILMADSSTQNFVTTDGNQYAQVADSSCCPVQQDCCVQPQQDCCFPDENYNCTQTPCQDCWCCNIHWEKICYNAKRAVTVDIPVKKRCVRCVPDNCSVQCCRYVCKKYCKQECVYEPEYCDQSIATNVGCCEEKPYRLVPKYYNVECCGYFPEYYCVNKCRTKYEYYYVYENCPRTTYVCEPRSQYIPRYQWTHICGNTKCCSPCPKYLPNRNTGSY
jgi:hypothetical protein